MEVVIAESPDHVARICADSIERLLRTERTPTLGLPTGSSPLPTYRELQRRYERGDVSFAGTRCFLLDEYVGLGAGHPQEYRSFIRREFVDRVDLGEHALFSPDGEADDLLAAAVDYERLIAEHGGIDLQLLGIGTDGHIGFNEPTSSLGSRTRLKTLTRETRSANARFFDNDIDAVPLHALTQGVGTILEARHLVLIATGAAKAAAIARTVEGPITAMHPASALQLHPHVTVLVDEEAARELSQADYYREIAAAKPDWQPY